MKPDQARDILTKQYVRVVGTTPTNGGWTVSEEVLSEIEKLEPFFGPPKEFLEDQVTAFLLRTGSGLNKPPRTAFFANTYLTAESSLEYLTKWRENLRFIINASSSHETFAGMVKADILAGEVQYLEGAISYGPPDPDMIRPPVWWIIASVQLGRFKYADVPEVWLEGTAPCLSAMLRPKPMMEVLLYEKGRLSKSKPLRDLLEESARIAIEEATYGWIQQHKIGVVINEGSQFLLVGGDQDFTDKVNGAIIAAPSVSLVDRDRRLRKLIGDYVSGFMQQEVLPANWWKSGGNEPAKKAHLGHKGPDLNDLMAGFMASGKQFDPTNEE